MNQKAFSLLECLLSLFLISLVLIPIVISFGKISTLSRKVHQSAKDANNLIQLNYLSEQILANLDYHRLDIPPHVHHAGILTFSDRSTLSLHDIKSSSDSISYLKLNWLETYLTQNSNPSSTNGEIIACELFKKYKKVKEKELFLGISLEGFQLLAGSSRSSTNSCRSFLLNLVPSVTLTISSETKQENRLLVPVVSENTLYLNREGRLKIITHYGKTIIENQTVLDSIEKVNYSLRFLPDLQVYYLLTQVYLHENREYHFSTINSLSIQPHFQPLLNYRIQNEIS